MEQTLPVPRDSMVAELLVTAGEQVTDSKLFSSLESGDG